MNGFDVYDASSSEFEIGSSDLSNLEIRDSGDGRFYYFFDVKGSRLIKHFVLKKQPRVSTLCEVKLIKKGNTFSPKLRVWKSSVGLSSSSATEIVDGANGREVKASVSLDDCSDEFWQLIHFLVNLKNVEPPKGSFTLIEHADRAFVQKVLSTFTTSAVQALLLDAKKDDVTNLYAAVRQAKNKMALAELERLIATNARELQFQEWFQGNTWAFGIEYLKILDISRIGIHSDSDFIAQSLDGYHDLIELKRPSLDLLKLDQSHDNWYPSAELSMAIGQAVNYLYAMERSRAELEEEDGISVLKPRIKVIAGSMVGASESKMRAMRLINNGLHGIEVISYDQVVARAMKLIEIFSPLAEHE